MFDLSRDRDHFFHRDQPEVTGTDAETRADPEQEPRQLETETACPIVQKLPSSKSGLLTSGLGQRVFQHSSAHADGSLWMLCFCCCSRCRAHLDIAEASRCSTYVGRCASVIRGPGHLETWQRHAAWLSLVPVPLTSPFSLGVARFCNVLQFALHHIHPRKHNSFIRNPLDSEPPAS